MADLQTQLQSGLGGSYALERELGRGGMATVFLARDLKHDRPVALKVLHPELAATLGPERFQREIRLAARLQHPHILTVLDSGDAAGRLWFTMPLVEGQSLRERLVRERQLPVEDALRITREAAQALQYAHEHGVIHRDIKPENLLLTRDGNTLVADFGIARALLAGAEEARLTETGLVVGTPAYMSPEQAAGDRGLDARTDIYSLAAVLYEMLAGEPPYTGATTQALVVKRLTEPAPSVRGVRTNVPEAVDGAIRKALAVVAADRFSTALEFAQALQATPTVSSSAAPIQKTALSPSASPPAEPATPPIPRGRRVPVAAAALVVGILIGLGVLFAWRRSHDTAAGGGGTGPKVLVVLPFENLGDSSDAYFADGVTDEVRTKLAQVSGLEVIARGSSIEYRGTAKRPAEIARELGADYLLTGTVRWEKAAGAASRVRVTPELVDARPGQAARTRWGQQFDAALTNVFQVQADIAAKVADALDVALGAPQREALAERPTANLAAYDAFLRGEEAAEGMGNTDLGSLRRGILAYEQAVALDSTFVQAWAQLARAHSALYYNGSITPEGAERARVAAERAVALAPTRPESRLALGDYHALVRLALAPALEQYSQGLRAAARSADLLTATAFVEQSVGEWEASLKHLEQARGVDPRSLITARRLPRALLWLRRYPEALIASDRGLELAPTNLGFLQTKAMIYLAQGDLAGARAVLRSAPGEVDQTALVAWMANFWDLSWLLDDEQQALLLRLTPGAFDDNRASWGLVLAETHALRDDRARSRAYSDTARLGFEEQLRRSPQNAQAHSLLGVALGYLGRKAEAIREGERGVALLPVAQDAYSGAYYQHLLVKTYILAGEPEKALDQLEPLLEIPYYLSPGWLRIDPTFDPLRKHPRFRRLVEGTS